MKSRDQVIRELLQRDVDFADGVPILLEGETMPTDAAIDAVIQQSILDDQAAAIDVETQTVILAGLGYELKDLQAAMIKQMNMIAEGSVLLSKRTDGSITETETARLNYLLSYRDFVDDCRAIGAQRKAGATVSYPDKPASVE